MQEKSKQDCYNDINNLKFKIYNLKSIPACRQAGLKYTNAQIFKQKQALHSLKN